MKSKISKISNTVGMKLCFSIIESAGGECVKVRIMIKRSLIKPLDLRVAYMVDNALLQYKFTEGEKQNLLIDITSSESWKCCL